MFPSKIVGSLIALLLAAPAAGDVVEYLCCDNDVSCDPNDPILDPNRCKYFYADPFPNTVDDIRALCPLNDEGEYPVACLRPDLVFKGQIDADYQCCDDCPENLDDCPFYYGRGPLADVENACEKFTLYKLSADGGALISQPPVGGDTCRVIVAAFGGKDPHFKTWGGDWYDFHGMCDLVMLDAPNFGNGQGLTIHSRTKDRYDYSYIESAAIKIGDNVFQLSSHGYYILDGVSQAELPSTIGGYTIRQTVQNNKESKFEIQISESKSIELSTFKDLVNVRAPVLNSTEFRTSKGLFGKFPSGELVGRDGTTVFKDHNEFGQEWQVLDSEPKLFQDRDRFPQHPHHKCVLPDPTKDSRRRLGESVAREAANIACSHWGDLKEMCVQDVIATGDIELAQSDHKMLM